MGNETGKIPDNKANNMKVTRSRKLHNNAETDCDIKIFIAETTNTDYVIDSILQNSQVKHTSTSNHQTEKEHNTDCEGNELGFLDTRLQIDACSNNSMDFG